MKTAVSLPRPWISSIASWHKQLQIRAEGVINRRAFLGATAGFIAPVAAVAKAAVMTVDYGPSRLDIHDPVRGKSLPVLLYVHGGAWQVGSRKDVDAKPAYFRDLGFVFVSADYRLGPFNKPDRQAADVAAAYNWVRENIAAHGGDPSRIVVMGHSAGNHLAALGAFRGDMSGVAGLILNDIQMYDIAKYAAIRGGLPRHFAYLFPERRWAALSPATYVGNAPIPPTLIAYSKMLHSRDLSLDFAATLKAAGGAISTFDGRAYKHIDIDRKIGAEAGGVSAAISEFLQRYR
jgi:acetyl esterase/lipase